MYICMSYIIYIYSHYTFQIAERVCLYMYSIYVCSVLNAGVMDVINNYYECKEVIPKSGKEEGGNKKNYMRNIVKSHVSRLKLKFSTSLRIQIYSHTHTNCPKNETDENHSFLGRASWLHSGHGRETL